MEKVTVNWTRLFVYRVIGHRRASPSLSLQRTFIEYSAPCCQSDAVAQNLFLISGSMNCKSLVVLWVHPPLLYAIKNKGSRRLFLGWLSVVNLNGQFWFDFLCSALKIYHTLSTMEHITSLRTRNSLFPASLFWLTDICRSQCAGFIYAGRQVPVDYLPDDHFAGRFICRTHSLPDGSFAGRTVAGRLLPVGAFAGQDFCRSDICRSDICRSDICRSDICRLDICRSDIFLTTIKKLGFRVNVTRQKYVAGP